MSAAVKKKQKKKPAQQERRGLSALLKSKEGKMLVRTGRTLYKIVFILLMFLILALNMQPVSVDYEAGEIADEDIYYSGNTTSYVSDLRT